MPAYFSLNIVFSRQDIYREFVKDFNNHLLKSGLKFKSGYYDDNNMSLDELVCWNQRKLECNFHLGFSEHYSHDYKQILFDFYQFSEVRGYWLNNFPSDDEFTFSIIIPESDLVENYSTNPLTFNGEIEKLKSLAESIWRFKLTKTIQSSPELANDIPTSLDSIKKGQIPLAEPFAIIAKEDAENLQSDDFIQTEIYDNGVLLYQKPVMVKSPKPSSVFYHFYKFLKRLF